MRNKLLKAKDILEKAIEEKQKEIVSKLGLASAKIKSGMAISNILNDALKLETEIDMLEDWLEKIEEQLKGKERFLEGQIDWMIKEYSK